MSFGLPHFMRAHRLCTAYTILFPYFLHHLFFLFSATASNVDTSESLADAHQPAYAAHRPIALFSSFIVLHHPPRNAMADFSIGDRVEVRWKAKPFATKVIHVHSAGKAGVVYDAAAHYDAVPLGSIGGAASSSCSITTSGPRSIRTRLLPTPLAST